VLRVVSQAFIAQHQGFWSGVHFDESTTMPKSEPNAQRLEKIATLNSQLSTMNFSCAFGGSRIKIPGKLFDYDVENISSHTSFLENARDI